MHFSNKSVSCESIISTSNDLVCQSRASLISRRRHFLDDVSPDVEWLLCDDRLIEPAELMVFGRPYKEAGETRLLEREVENEFIGRTRSWWLCNVLGFLNVIPS